MPHIHEKIDYCADAYIVNGDAVLLRFHEKYDTWLPPGGHVELHEDPEEAAIREAKEEVGLDIVLVGNRLLDVGDGDREVLAPRFINRHRISDTHEHVVFEYFATSATRAVAPRAEEQDVEIRWFTKEELNADVPGLWEKIRRYANLALDELAQP
jgi:8-oxo-dGTP pyrophosphatase MutT (NUDIX family)